MTAVTQAQENFLQNLMHGMTQRQAYIAAFPKAKKWKPESVDAQACALLKTHKVAIRYAELQQEAQEANAITRDSILTRLKDFANAPLDYDKIRPADQIRALELMAKILGIDSPPDDED